ncbi:GlcG/HbpS family heme-binding protein [Nitrosomonas sp. Is37]|uniref:GlcG/HbpS family heme-binding protein n=1 Tax=Nitrosomonas sp. Is37 TaxID=3080535 RepID=UPI00294B0CBE|nr:heme-binding protein [Nitrosomonas sp. Is37]MDV6344352.1 heme-binding protein [Nitrosomonas sp. Is37]
MYKINLSLLFLLLFSVFSITTHATQIQKPFLPLSLANKIVAAAVQQCEQNGFQVSVAVVDQSGVIRAQVRMDGAGAHTIESSFRKAYTSASLKLSTLKIAQIAAKDPELQGLHHMANNILLLGGGLPIKINGEVVGGIGVGGAPGEHRDEVCAEAGLKSIEENK